MPQLALYHYSTCFFCLRVRGALKMHGIEAELRNIHKEQRWSFELMEARGRQTVPVLRIEKDNGEVEWMGESADIVKYLGTL